MKRFKLPEMELDLTATETTGFSLSQETAPAGLSSHARTLQSKFESGDIGFFDWPEAISPKELSEIQLLAAKLRKQFNAVLVCGIGGSHLGAAALIEALRPETDEAAFPIFWLNNVDPSAMARAETFVKKHKVATLLISKSGNTTETLAGFFHLSRHLPKEGIIAITDPHSGELRRMATENRWDTLNVPPNIGGRFSVLTAVGLLPVALAGLDTTALLTGARAMRTHLSALPPNLENPAVAYAVTKFQLDQKGHGIHYLMPYHSNLKLLAEWYVQLWGESLGKKTPSGHAVGPTFVAALGTRDQHSLLQLFKEGPNNKLIGFIDIKKCSELRLIGGPSYSSTSFSYLAQHSFANLTTKALNATQQSLKSAGVPTYLIHFSQLDEASLGAFLFFQEYACAFAGELYGIDAFRQPGVEEAKKLLRDSL